MRSADDIAEWLLRQLGADEDSRWPHRLDCRLGSKPLPLEAEGLVMVTLMFGTCDCDMGVWWLREVESKRDILKAHPWGRDHRWDYEGHLGWRCRACDNEYPCQTLRLLARPYRDREGYRAKEWRPTP